MGTYSLTATTTAGDQEYFTINIPDSSVLWAINHISWTSQDPMGFIGLQSGMTFTEPSNLPNPSNMLGWTHFGTGMGTVGHDLLPLLAQGVSAIGFTPPLPSGSYTFWIQQTSSRLATYQLDFVMIPSPSAAAMLPGVFMLGRRRRV